MKQYYIGNHLMAKSDKPVVWIAIVVPIELLKGFDLVVAVPENHSAMCAAKRVGVLQAEKAESKGYSMDLCSYARIDLGTLFANGKGSPSQGLPKPDFLISDNNNCSLLVKWFDVISRELDIEHFVLDVPFCYEPMKEKDLQYIVAQFRSLIDFTESITNQKFEINKVQRAIEYTNKAIKHWKRFLSYAQHHPSGITAFDSFVHMAPYLTWHRGTRKIVKHFKMLADETEQQMKEGQFPVPNEKYRLLWDNIAPWHQLRPMSSRLAELDANIIYASYTSCMGTIEGKIDAYTLNKLQPLKSLARVQNATVCPYGLDLRTQAMSEMIKRYDIDGIVFTNNFSCKVYSIMQLDLMKNIQHKYEIPCVMIDVDHADVRKYNEANVFLKLEALIEQIDVKREKTT
ncbi:MAG: 2-hydroxyacyl-CoA dehydratase [Candidatus Lokiarchaeota archaeon]|nr:2-hydroxyacyl-CoA dehydratase [Candidatus Lokiarchaeota archaeon]MBD3337835.1 2-hydroxyacyl-CoA dehydratase [Candidatus Lokiarchaeota archaeon]